MSPERKDLEALELALRTEEEGYALYKRAAKLKLNDLTAALFSQLAKDELMHKDLIRRFYAKLKKSDSWTELSEEDKNYQGGSKQKYKTIFSDALAETKKVAPVFTSTDKEAYQKALEFEKKGMELYDRLYNETTDPVAKKFYLFLREMEREHMELLDNAIRYVESPDNYYILEEGWTMED
ncbi:MAG TPA: hypothetical protein ENK14_10350 [Caldithrix sp.]|nr:hypothetical protein [Caldithrix sp.]